MPSSPKTSTLPRSSLRAFRKNNQYRKRELRRARKRCGVVATTSSTGPTFWRTLRVRRSACFRSRILLVNTRRSQSAWEISTLQTAAFQVCNQNDKSIPPAKTCSSNIIREAPRTRHPKKDPKWRPHSQYLQTKKFRSRALPKKRRRPT